ncbi:hypothetical protein B0H19DRAFT_1225853 [Mycena capillaripes]|nr:hypothetical protein B0H19DRAFT_1225853 [Mycena capillaripes]
MLTALTLWPSVHEPSTRSPALNSFTDSSQALNPFKSLRCIHEFAILQPSSLLQELSYPSRSLCPLGPTYQVGCLHVYLWISVGTASLCCLQPCRPIDFPVRTSRTRRSSRQTGPTDRKMVINALNSGAKTFMGEVNLCDAICCHNDFELNGIAYQLSGKPAVLFVRPHGWHLDEPRVTVNNAPSPVLSSTLPCNNVAMDKMKE